RCRLSFVARVSIDDAQSSRPSLKCAMERCQQQSHGRPNSLCGLCFYQPQFGIRARHKEVHFQTLLITKIVEFLAHSTMGLALEYFCCDEAFEQRTQEGRSLKLSR